MTDLHCNPYEAPGSSVEDAATNQQRTGWRIIPVTLLTIWGSLYLLISPMPLFTASKVGVKYDGGITPSRILGTLLLVCAALAILYSAVCCWRGLWGRLAIILAAAIATIVVTQHLLSGPPSW